MTTYQCAICGWVYDEASGSPEEGIAPGTRWEEIPDDWECPVCGAGKGDFEMVPVVSNASAASAASVAAPFLTADTKAAPLVIIGAGMAAYTLAREFRKLDSASPLVIVTRDGGGYYTKPALSNALANRISPADLVSKTVEQMTKELQADIRPRTEVASIDPVGRQLVLADGSRLPFGRLVIAWGADPLRLALPGDGADAIQSVNDLDDYRRFHASLENARTVAVIGAGLIGCEFANDLANHGIAVRLIGRTGWPLDRLLPEDAGKMLAASLHARGVEFLGHASVVAIAKADSGYRLELADGHTLVADRVLSAIGLRPRTTLAEAAGIACAKGIVTNRLLETGIDGIYAMGDCAEIAGFNLPFIQPIMLQAKALARTLTGTPTAVHYPAMPVVVKTPACPVVVCPPPVGAGGTWECEAVDGGLQAYFRGSTGQLSGFALLGSATTQSPSLAARLPAVLD